MQLVLRDIDPHVVLAWTQVFGGRADISFGVGDLLRTNVDAVVSPANSAGIMDALAALRAASRVGNPPIERLGVPGMGTGVGRMDPYESAEQMLAAIETWAGDVASG